MQSGMDFLSRGKELATLAIEQDVGGSTPEALLLYSQTCSLLQQGLDLETDTDAIVTIRGKLTSFERRMAELQGSGITISVKCWTIPRTSLGLLLYQLHGVVDGKLYAVGGYYRYYRYYRYYAGLQVYRITVKFQISYFQISVLFKKPDISPLVNSLIPPRSPFTGFTGIGITP